jgi:hypothetical protein
MDDYLFDSKIKNLHVLPGIVFGYVAMAMGVFSLFLVISGYGSDPEYDNTTFLWIFGTLVLAMGIFFSFSYEGITINLRNNQYREYLSVAGMRFGKWQPLPPVEAIKVAPFRPKYTIRDFIRPGMVMQENKYKLSLFLENDKFALVVAITNRKNAVEKAHRLAAHFNVEVLDYIEPV